MALGTKLKDLLTERGITVKDFAKQIGVPPTTLYSFIKRDSDDVKLELVTKICNGLGIKVTDFLKTIDCIDGKTTTIFDLTNFDENEIEKVHDKIIDESKTPTIANRFDGDKHFLDYLIPDKNTLISKISKQFYDDHYTREELQKISEYAEFIKSQRKE